MYNYANCFAMCCSTLLPVSDTQTFVIMPHSLLFTSENNISLESHSAPTIHSHVLHSNAQNVWQHGYMI